MLGALSVLTAPLLEDWWGADCVRNCFQRCFYIIPNDSVLIVRGAVSKHTFVYFEMMVYFVCEELSLNLLMYISKSRSGLCVRNCL